MRIFNKIYLLALLVVVAMSCSGKSSDTVADNSVDKETTKINKELENCTKVLLETSLGNITVALYNETPQHRDNFVKLVNEGYYNGVLFHRVIKDFMIQTGDGNSKNAKSDDMLGTGDPGYTIPAEIVFPKYFHKRGALAAARTADQVNPERRSSGSQFYIVTGKSYSPDQVSQLEQNLINMKKQEIFNNLASAHRKEIMLMRRDGDSIGLQKLQDELISQLDAEYEKSPVSLTDAQREAYTTIGGTPHLDGQYTVFGEVLDGMDVVDKIQNVETGRNDRPVSDVKIISAKVVK